MTPNSVLRDGNSVVKALYRLQDKAWGEFHIDIDLLLGARHSLRSQGCAHRRVHGARQLLRVMRRCVEARSRVVTWGDCQWQMQGIPRIATGYSLQITDFDGDRRL